MMVALTLLATAAALYLAFLLHRSQNARAAQGAAAERDHSAAMARAQADADLIAELQRANARLSRWESVADADETSSEMLRAAREEVARAGREAEGILADARAKAAEFIATARATATELATDAKQKRDTAAADASERIRAATIQATVIVEEAQRKAEEIAGKALRALETAEENERAAQALQNVIDGYGDRYVVPGHSLLDDLAEETGFAEAGQQLKLVRDRVRAMVHARRAATCDYVEQNRKDTAIRFVVHAFNGMADSILARVKADNAGTLQREMRDAFALVNLNGRAFRNARITQEYLDLRLEELRWAAVAHQIKLQERDEQRRIKEQIREEEKARREYERAIRDAAKDEEMLRRAMEKAEQQMARANEEQRAVFEAQLAGLAEKLKAAEERNQRAISMAQQTRRGHVYVISNIGSFGEHVYKIGLTRRLEPQDRIRELGDSSVPFEFDVHALIFTEDAPALENRLHKHFALSQVNKVNPRKEFFRADLGAIRSEIEGLGLTTQWTMSAGAREYRESLAIERAISENPTMREAWLSRQPTLDVSAGWEDEDDDTTGVTTTSAEPLEVPLP